MIVFKLFDYDNYFYYLVCVSDNSGMLIYYIFFVV